MTTEVLHRPSAGSVGLLLLAALAATAGCAPTSAPRTQAAAPAPTRPATTPVAIVAGREITWDELRPALAEAAGAAVLRETVLDGLIDRELSGRGLELSPADVDAERTILLDSVSQGARLDAAEAQRIIDNLRAQRGLGERRFAAQLRRSAGLRRLVAGTVTVTDEEVQRAFDLAHGPRLRARALVVADRARAAAVRDELQALPPERRAAALADLAVKESTDGSAPRGGALDPISPADPTYPAAVRSALDALSPGELSPVIGTERGFAVLLLEGRDPADGTTLDAARERLRTQVRLAREREAMDGLATDLLRRAKVTVLDRGVAWSWDAGTR